MLLITQKNIRAPGKLLCLLLVAVVCFSGCKLDRQEKPVTKPAAPVTNAFIKPLLASTLDSPLENAQPVFRLRRISRNIMVPPIYCVPGV